MTESKSVWVNLMGAELRFIQGKKYRTRVAIAGEGNSETLMMMHGGGGHLETFAFNVVPLAQHFRVVAMESLWHGLSSAPEIETNRNTQLAEQVFDVMDALGLDDVWMHGEAQGAQAVLHIALNHPERFKGFIFESGGGVAFKEGTVNPPLPPVGGIPMGERTLALLKEPTWQGVKDRLLMVMHYQHPERVTDELVDIRYAHYSRASTNDAQTRYYTSTSNMARFAPTEEDIAGIDKPVLVVWCDGSGGLGPDAGERMASIIPGAKFKKLPETGYWAHWERHEDFNEAVRQFIQGEAIT